jgi:CRP/FNR family transcriptional regulator
MNALRELQRFEPFKKLTANSQQLLSQGTNVQHVPRGTDILYKGQPVSGAYVVLEGSLRIFTIGANGSEATLYFVNSGEACVLALNCLFNDLLYPAWVQAESTTRVAVIPGIVYRKLFESERIVQNLTVQALSTLVYRLMSELDQLHSSNHKQRLVSFILSHATSDGLLRMTQQQLAQHLGTTREVIARLIQELVAAGMLRSQRGQIAIRDVFALRRIIAPAPSNTERTRKPRAGR